MAVAATAAAGVAVLGLGVIAPSIAGAAPHPHHTPHTISGVQRQLSALAKRNDRLVEQYDQAQVAFRRSSAAEAEAQAASRAAARRLTAAQVQLGQSAAAQYEGGAFSTAGALLASPSGASYLDQLDTMSMVSTHNAQIVAEFTAARTTAAAAQRRAVALVAQTTRTRNRLAAQRLATIKQIQHYKLVLATLTAQQRAAYSSTHVVSQAALAKVSSTPISSQAARIAVQFALAQVGKPYVFGAAGPDSFDCSGLTMSAWAAAGVSLPHSAAEQFNYGTHVSFDQLQPGDLLFFYQPIGHVAIYIGNGLMVSAPEPGEDVQVVPADAFGSDFVGATRLVG